MDWRVEVWGVAIISAFAAVSCSSGKSSQSDNSGDVEDYEASYCAYLAKCGGAPQAECLDQLANFGIDPNKSAKASACVTQLKRLDCSNVPTGCDPRDLFSQVFVDSVCGRLAKAWCKDAEACVAISSLECEAEVDAQLCNTAVSFASNLSACESASASATCAMQTIPEQCRGVVITQ